ncbi:MAG: type II toxin-antitoxin system RelE/ParE family toxin, partial [Bauldia sp.]
RDFAVFIGGPNPALRGDRKGEYSIRVNQQWRICFVWSADGPDRVEIVDYHS